MADITRRELLRRFSLMGGLALSYPAALLAENRQMSPVKEVWEESEQWQSLKAVQEILFPADEETPGAADINAHQYLYRTIENPLADGDEKEMIYDGVGWLNDLSQQRHKVAFIELTANTQDLLLKKIAQSKAGRRWISKLLTFLLEALLSDPVYGGNPNGIGWQWLEHQPGYPSPTVDKTWDKLLQARSQL